MKKQSPSRRQADARRDRPGSPYSASRSVIEPLEQRVLLAANAIVLENQLPGSPWSEWHINGAGDLTIQGYATDISVDQGETVHFKIDEKSAAPYRLDIYRMGYYNGEGARKVATLYSASATQVAQPAPLYFSATGTTDAGNWSVTDSWNVPVNATSGIYFAKVTRLDTGGASHIVFIVRDDDGGSDLLFQTSDTTWHAYNNYGGKSLYDHQSPGGRATKVSYNRPFLDRNNDGINSFVFTSEYPMVLWLESNGYDVSYFTGVDSARLGGEILEHDVFMGVGHDEYWSGEMRQNVTAARDAGVDLAFFTANQGFWKVRWEDSMDGTNTDYRTLVCYKESNLGTKTDPSAQWTGTWRDPRFSPPSDGGLPENELTGTLFMVNSMRNDPMYIPADDGKLRFWRNTSVADLPVGGVATLPAGVLGYEWDVDPDNGFRPAGLINLSHTTMSDTRLLSSENATYSPGPATHSLTMYRAASGALVFGAGTVQWSWGLDSDHDRAGTASDVRMQQATVNLFADMGVQASTLRPGLLQTTASTDNVAPTSAITWSPAGTIKIGDIITISGTASDGGGGLVGGVEVSVDGGATWHEANGREAWTYSWRVATGGAVQVMSRATDDSLRTETPAAGVPVQVQGQNGISIWGSSIPLSAPTADAQVASSGGIEFGVKFRSDVAGQVLGVRFYKFMQNTGAHTGSLWSSTGELLAKATFTNETFSGWQEVRFSGAVTILPGQTYVVSYHTVKDFSPADDYYFVGKGADNGPLHALPNGFQGGNGVYKYGTGGFPTEMYRSANYYADVVFSAGDDTAAPTIVDRDPAAGAVNVSRATNVTATFSEAITSSTASMTLTGPGGVAVAGAVAYDVASRTLRFTPTNTLEGQAAYTVVVSGAKDASGNTMVPVTWSFTTALVDSSAPTVTSRTPAVDATGVPAATAVSVTFSEGIDPLTASMSLSYAGGTVAGTVSYNAATHGLTFQPVSTLASMQLYTVSVSGAADLSGNVMLPVSWSFTTADAGVPMVTAHTPASDATGVTANSITATFSEAIEPGTGAFVLTDQALGNVPGLLSYNTTTHVLTFQPISPLAGDATYTVTISGVLDLAGNLMTPVSWSFTTAARASAEVSIYNDALLPDVAIVVDPNTIAAGGVELGLKFRSDVSGYVLGLQYYKGSGNTGEHTGSLWSSAGQLLAQTVFGAGTASGWQHSYFGSPIAIQPGQTYVVSYHTTTDRWLRTSNFFYSEGTDAAPLHALASSLENGNGVYSYGSASTFPVQAFSASNYWVDPVFIEGAVSDTLAPGVSYRTPAADAVEVPIASAITARFTEVIDSATAMMTVLDAAGQTVAGTTTYDANTWTLKFQPTAPLARDATYTVTVSGAADLSGNVMTPVTWSFRTVAPTTGEVSLWSLALVPTGTSLPDTATRTAGGVSLGMKFRSDVSGRVLGLEFYKAIGDTGTHIGSLWSSAGQLLAQVNFSNETASGWQKMYFSQPVAVQAGQTYTISYHTTKDYWFRTNGYFASAGVDSGPLHALAQGVDGGNGVYAYGSMPQNPVSSYLSTNYWVDVLFSEDPVDGIAPTVVAQTPYANALHVAINSGVSATFSEPIDPATAVITLTPRFGSAVAGALRYTASTNLLSFRPSTALSSGTTYTVTISGAKDLAGNLMTPVAWTFKTAPQMIIIPGQVHTRGLASEVSRGLASSVADIGRPRNEVDAAFYVPVSVIRL